MKILADENIAELESYFGPFGSLKKLPGRAIDREAVRDTDVLLVRSVTRIDKTLLEGSKVRFVASATIGVDHVDQQWLKEQGIGFCSAPGCNASAVADYDLLALLEAEAARQKQDSSFRLADRSLAIVGYGHVGRAVEKKLAPYFASVVVCDPPLAQLGQQGLVDFEEALKQEVICFHTPLTQSGDHPTLHLLNRQLIEGLAPGTLLLNAGRGGVIDEAALLDRLQRQEDLTLILDVWANEPKINASLLACVFLGTPHIAGYSVLGKRRGTEMIFAGFCEFFKLTTTGAAGAVPEFIASGDSMEDRADPSRPKDLIALRRLYDIRQDHANLLKLLELEGVAAAEYFDQLRKSYKLRPDL